MRSCCVSISLIALLGSACTTPLEGNGVPGDIDAGVCYAYEYNGEVYDCDALDRCTETDFAYRAACCECDPRLCNPDPNCPGPDGGPDPVAAETCMECHNGAEYNDYGGPGISNPHPFTGADNVSCTTCHGGNGQGAGKLGSHVPPPPQIGDRVNQTLSPYAYFNRLTLAGLDKLPDYTVGDKSYRALDYLQFVNPGDMRVISEGRACGAAGCHAGQHAEWAMRTPIATEAGILSGTLYAAGIENSVPTSRGLYQDTAADVGFRQLIDLEYIANALDVGRVSRLLEFPEKAQYGDTTGVFQNAVYDAAALANYVYTAAEDPTKTNRVKAGSPLATLVAEQVQITCGDCHLGSAGANNRFADFRSSGCTSCHMEYSYDGRSRSLDPNVNKLEPANPDAIAAPERPHVDRHQIRNVAKILPNGGFLRGISDRACVGCHQGSNRTVLQYWGIRLDQNQDLTNGFQYPANPVTFSDTAEDVRLYDPAVGNATFNGRVAAQHILFEDYDGDGRDDTPPDVHYEAGLGCIDCHGERDLHGGATGDPTSGKIVSRQDQATAIQCTSCHGGIAGYAATTECVTYAGETASCAVDSKGNALRHVTRDAAGDYWLLSRLDGQRHFLPQTKDTVVNNGKRNPVTLQLVYSPKASYAMGRADGNPLTGTGPQQTDPTLVATGFSHTDNLDCVSCHASWTNNCTGCHLKNQYDDNPGNYYFSNITGERTVLFQANADFVYQSPVPFYLGVNSRNKVTTVSPAEKWFYRYQDLNGVESQVFAFSDRNGNGNNPNVAGRNALGSLSHNQMMPHSIRGKVATDKEGPRYCVACHITQDGLAQYGAEYDAFRTAMANNDFAALDFALLAQHIGANTGNQLGSPIWVHMAVGLGSGLFLFDETGCPVNPLDNNANRQYCPDGAPAANFDPANAVYNLDRVVEATGIANSSSNHPMLQPGVGKANRGGALNQNLSGPLGAALIQKLADPVLGKVLDSWIDANGQAQGDAANYIQ